MENTTLRQTVKSVVNESHRAVDAINFNACSVPQTMRNVKTGAVYSVLFNHSMGQYELTPLTRSTRGVHYRNDLANFEPAGTGNVERNYSGAAI